MLFTRLETRYFFDLNIVYVIFFLRWVLFFSKASTVYNHKIKVVLCIWLSEWRVSATIKPGFHSWSQHVSSDVKWKREMGLRFFERVLLRLYFILVLLIGWIGVIKLKWKTIRPIPSVRKQPAANLLSN